MSRLLAEVAGDDLELVRLRGEEIKTIYKRSNDLKESEGNHHYIHGALIKFKNKYHRLSLVLNCQSKLILSRRRNRSNLVLSKITENSF